MKIRQQPNEGDGDGDRHRKERVKTVPVYFPGLCKKYIIDTMSFYVLLDAGG
jgi:hypothetical protein